MATFQQSQVGVFAQGSYVDGPPALSISWAMMAKKSLPAAAAAAPAVSPRKDHFHQLLRDVILDTGGPGPPRGNWSSLKLL